MSYEVVRLGELVDLKNGFAFKSTDYIEFSNTMLCRMSNIKVGGFFDIDYSAKFLPDDFSDKYSAYLLNDGDLVIAMTDLANDPKILGVPTLVKTNGRKILLNQRVGKIEIKTDKLHIPYLKLALSQKSLRKYFAKFAGGGLQINIGKKEILGAEIPLPPLDIQKKIADTLDKAQELIDKRKEQISALDKFLENLFLDMFGDPVSNPIGWEEKSLEALSHKITDGKHGDCVNDENSNYYFISAKDLINGKIDYSNARTILKKDFEEVHRRTDLEWNDVLIVSTGASIGKTALAKSQELVAFTTFQKSVAIIKNKRELLSSHYLKNYLDFNTKFIHSVSTGSGQKNGLSTLN